MSKPIAIRASQELLNRLERSGNQARDENITQTVRRLLEQALDAEDGPKQQDQMRQLTSQVTHTREAVAQLHSTVSEFSAEVSWLHNDFKSTAYRVLAGFVVGLFLGTISSILVVRLLGNF